MTNRKYRDIDKQTLIKVASLNATSQEKMAFLDYIRKEKLSLESVDKFSSFSEFVIKDEKEIDRQTGMGKPIVLQDFHIEWCDLLQYNNRLIVFSPRETGKSTIFSVSYPLWRLGNDPNLRIAIISAASHQSKRILGTMKQYITSDTDLKSLFPNLKPLMDEINVNKPKKWSLEQIIVDRPLSSRDASIVCYGVGSKSILGSRFDLVLLDDVLGPHNTSTKHEMDKVIEWYSNVLEKCLVESGQIVCVGTAWNSSDLMHYLEKKDGWKCVKYSFDKEDEVDSYHWVDWPKRHSKEKLDKERKNDIISYNRNRRCRTSSTEERPFEDQFNTVSIRDYDLANVRQNGRKFMGVDLATKKRKGTAITVVSTDGSTNYVIDTTVGAWRIGEKVDKIKEYYDIYRPELIYVENNALQDDIVDAINSSGFGTIPIKPFTTGAAKHNSLERLALEVSNGKWRFAYPSRSQDVIDGKSIDDSPWSRFLMEVKMYPDYPSNDMIMSWMFASEALKKNVSGDLKIGVISFKSDEDRILESRPFQFGFKDYTVGNRISLNKGVVMDAHKPIVNYIKSNAIWGSSFNFDSPSIPFPAEDVKMVYEDMDLFCREMNGIS